jgi:hypothetical protein
MDIGEGSISEMSRSEEWASDHPQLPGQFVLSREKSHLSGGWRADALGGWHLHTHPALVVSDVVGPSGERVGWLLGNPIDTERQAMQIGQFRLRHTACAANAGDIERQLYRLAGRYVLVVLLGEGLRRLYLDPCGSLSVVYSLTHSLVGSTPEALGNSRLAEVALIERIRVTREASGTLYPCGLTPYHNLRVLPPNHYLDLDDWFVRRHWPTRAPAVVSGRGQCLEIVQEIAGRITGNIRAVVDAFPTVMSLTAGRDTRMLLACARPIADRLLFVTSATHSEVDAKLAKLMAHLLSLKHSINDAGFPERVLLSGVAGEVGRAFYWSRHDKENTRLTGRLLGQRMHFPDGGSVFEHELDAWLGELRDHNIFFVLDLAYVEQRLAMAHAPAEYGNARAYRFSLYPMNDRRTLDLMLSLPVQYRREQKLWEDICRVSWPSLRLFPINAMHFTGMRKYRIWWESRRLTRGWTPEQKRSLDGVISRNRSLPRMVRDDLANVLRASGRR